ncbi:hypothetical protein ACFX2I_036340 [Malus domestica]|uniref:uncharacterized protein n=1 Tax=Malus domestica TaxID=3750 RepID=UPI0004992EAF|nr:uncharacterized protein LOC103435161 [Malus domestica]XP_050147546.1 uncharacterized protein LOC126622908 [Malus sylvestris]
MANARLARFITEVAPPQFVSVMRQGTSKVLDTINEEEREYVHTPNDSLPSSSSNRFARSSSSSSSAPSFASASASGAESKYFLRKVRRSLSVLGN